MRCSPPRGLGVPGVAAPSANRFGRISPTRAQHVVDEFSESGADLLVLDGGDCEVGIESTIVDCTARVPALLRPGQIARQRIEAVLGPALAARDADSPRASGTLEAHYAPRAKLRLMPGAMLNTALQMLGDSTPLKLAVYSRTVPLPSGSRLTRRAMPDAPDRAATNSSPPARTRWARRGSDLGRGAAGRCRLGRRA